MTSKKQNIIIWILRIIISGFFILSAFSKLLPANSAIFLFEKQIVDLGITNWCIAPLLARAIIGFELFLGIAILQNHFLKTVIVPATFLLLLAFCIHLTIVIINTGNHGSCGCFGQLIPMTPLEAIIKNVISMIVLAYIFIKCKDPQKNLFRYPVAIFILVYLGIFIFLSPKCCCANNTFAANDTVALSDSTTEDTTVTIIDTAKTKAVVKENNTHQDTAKVKTSVKSSRPKVSSVFTKYTKFSGKTVDVNSGKKIICLFSLECEHCQESNKILQELKKSAADFPEVYILAFGEEPEVDGFFSAGGGKFPFTIIPPEEFFPLLDKANNPPRIVVLDNGNIISEFINFEHLDKKAVLDAVKK